ncbi:hypothetical protein KBD33_05820 [Candidatus Gracilibacteria bacterium]|nr:hypothetical protein [Candidatus Gracilibacteria bacterium]
MKKSNQLVNIQVAQATSLVTTGDYRGAENALQEIANKEGDKALILALRQVPSKDLALILVNTATQPSAICSGLVEPSAFVNALIELPWTWKLEDESTAYYDLQDMFLGVVMRLDPASDKPREALKFLKAILKKEQAIQMFAYFLQPKKDTEVLKEIEKQVDDGSDPVDVNILMSDDVVNKEPPVVSMKSREYEFHVGEADNLLALVHKVPRLYEKLQILWSGELTFSDLFPGIQKSQAVSAL